MTNGDDARMEHPDELLAGYVEGSASPGERRTVEKHLAGCSQCRKDLALATAARTALASLPQLEAPGLAPQGVEALRAGATRPVGQSAERQTERIPVGAGVESGAGDELSDRRAAKREAGQRRQWQVSWAALAGVAAVLAVLAVVPFVLNRGGTPKSTGALAPAASPGTEAANYPSVLDRSSNYDQASIQALARQLGEAARKGFKNNRATGASPLASSVEGASPRLAAVSAPQVVRCAVQGTGLPAGTVPVYLETATYQGTPAYVVAILAEGGNRSHVRVYAISRQDCTFLYEADQPL
ncbi:MAG TPA: zf-HC2 domain-containing protein [Actinomycetota bacterium]|nr:zf-HC2 domain-containing protein [Actinomycetota bacterium]